MKFFRWGIADKVISVTTQKPLDSRYLTPYMDITELQELVTLAAVPGSKEFEITDFLHTGAPYPIIMSPKAKDALGQFLKESGQLTSVDVIGVGQYYAFTPRKVLDVIDTDRSQFRKPNRISFDETPVFLPVDPPESTVFLAEGFENQKIWVTEEFCALVADAGLTGAEFW